MPTIKLPTLYAIKKNGGILDKWSKANGITVLSFVYSEQVNLQEIINAEFKTVKFRDCYVFDVQACKGNDDDFITCMQSVQYQTDARIVVYAGEHYAGDNLLDRLVKCGITNIVAKYDHVDVAENMSLMLADLAECMSEDGLSRKKWRRYEKGYDPTAEARYEAELLKKEREKPTYANAKLKIAVVGAQARIGTTSTAIHIADYFAHHKASAAVFAADGSAYSDEQLAMINDANDGEDNDGYYTVGGIELYPNGCQPVLDYNVEVYDLGVLDENNAEKLSAFDRIYLVGGISWNEFPLTYQSQTLIGQYNYTILVNFCDNERLNAPIQIDGGSMDAAMSTPKGGKDASQPSVGGSSSSYGRLLNEVNMQNVLCLPFVPDTFGSEVFESLFDKEFSGYRDTTE